MLLYQGAHAGLTKSYVFFPFVRPYKVLFLGIFDQRGLIVLFLIEKEVSVLTIGVSP